MERLLPPPGFVVSKTEAHPLAKAARMTYRSEAEIKAHGERAGGQSGGEDYLVEQLTDEKGKAFVRPVFVK